MLKPAYLSLLSEDKMQITREPIVGSKSVHMWEDQLEELMKMQPYSKLNEKLFRDYGFLFTREIEYMKNRVSEILEDDMTDLCGFNLD